jgi:2-polyprenyl-3-methyl-5-hydroxy-6-metoxy-1,4-benzoquinol methylase
MDRRCEPELMDGDEQALAYARADFDAVDAAFVDSVFERFPQLRQAHIVDLGCGPAAIPIRFCQAAEGIEVTAIDGAPAMIDLAIAAVAEAGLSERITCVCQNLPGEALLTWSYDGLVSNSLLHHLHDPQVMWTEVKRQLRPGAPVMIMDLRRPADEAAAQGLVDEYSADEPEVLRTDFYNSLLAAFTPAEVEAQLADAGLTGLSVEAAGDRHLMITGTR